MNIVNSWRLSSCYGLEISRVLVDSCYRELVIERHDTEKRYIHRPYIQLLSLNGYDMINEMCTGESS